MLFKDREKSRKAQWEIFSSKSLPEVVRKATEMGWEKKEVQVRADEDNYGNRRYIIEPFEKDCGCPSLLKFEEWGRLEETLLPTS